MRKQPKETGPRLYPLRYTPEQRKRWELARRREEARRFPAGERSLSLQEWIAETLDRAAEP